MKHWTVTVFGICMSVLAVWLTGCRGPAPAAVTVTPESALVFTPTPTGQTTVEGEILDVTSSSQTIKIEPQNGFDSITLTSETQVFGTDGQPVDWQTLQPGDRISAQGIPSNNQALAANRIDVLEWAAAATTPQPETSFPATPTGPMPEAAQSVASALATRLQLQPADVVVVGWQAVDWPTACLGAAAENETCAAVITPGYVVTVTTPSGVYAFHTDTSGTNSRLVAAPEVQLSNIVASRQATDGGVCRELAIYASGAAAVGRCGGPKVTSTVTRESNHLAELQHYLSLYAPISYTDANQTVRLDGLGKTEAGPPEKRAAAFWLQLITLEADAGHLDPNLAFLGSFERRNGPSCEYVSLATYGLATVVDCAAPQPVTLGQLWLTTAELDQLYGWYDRLATIDTASLPLDSGSAVLSFHGQGQETLSDNDRSQIASIMTNLYARGAAMTYVNRELGFAIHLPEGWEAGQVSEAELGKSVGLGPKPLSSPPLGSVTVDMDPAATRETVESWFGNKFGEWFRDDVVVNGQPAERLTVKQDGQEYYIVPMPGRVYVIHIPTNANNPSSPVDIVNSFQVLPVNPAPVQATP